MDAEPSLFPLPEMVSPMEEWRKRHYVSLYPTMSGFRAATVQATAYGDTKEAALLAWADKAKIPCWKKEELDRVRTNPTER